MAVHAIGDTNEEAWAPDWEAIATQIVERTLDLHTDERVVYLVDPYLVPDCFDAVRAAVLRRGGIEQATMLGWSRRIAQELRTPLGEPTNPDALRRERQAHMELLNTADVFMWLPTNLHYPGGHTRWESEWMLGQWRGRGLHFHWFPDPGSQPDDPINEELARIYQRAILDLDYDLLRARQQRLLELVRGQRIQVSTPEGTALAFTLPRDGWYHLNDGNGSREKALHAVCARDREQELPSGALRSIPEPDSVEGIVSLRGPVAYNGFGLPINEFWDHLDLVYRDGRVTEVRSGNDQARLEAAWDKLTGDKDRLGEVVFGTNPLLEKPLGATMPTYWGFGEGMFRLHLGDNIESGGTFASDLRLNLFLQNATVRVNGETVVDNAQLLVD